MGGASYKVTARLSGMGGAPCDNCWGKDLKTMVKALSSREGVTCLHLSALKGHVQVCVCVCVCVCV